MLFNKLSRFLILILVCFSSNLLSGTGNASTASQSSQSSERADLIRRGFLIGLHLYKQKLAPDWVKNAKTAGGTDLTSSFEEIGKILGEIVDYKMDSSKAPTIDYYVNSMSKPAHWNYVFVKKWIYSKIIDGAKYDLEKVASDLLTRYGDSYRSKIEEAKSDAKCYIDGLKLDDICNKIRASFQNTQKDCRHHMLKEFFGLAPFEIFPRLAFKNGLPETIKELWKPDPSERGHWSSQHGLPSHRKQGFHHHPGQRSGPPHDHYWFISFLSNDQLSIQNKPHPHVRNKKH